MSRLELMLVVCIVAAGIGWRQECYQGRRLGPMLTGSLFGLTAEGTFAKWNPDFTWREFYETHDP
jgi:hypothetical protein